MGAVDERASLERLERVVRAVDPERLAGGPWVPSWAHSRSGARMVGQIVELRDVNRSVAGTGTNSGDGERPAAGVVVEDADVRQ